jgi:Flp pilus assembly protein TadB
MSLSSALFLFLAAAVVAVFAFCSIVVWITTPSRERQVRDRLALLKTLAEQPGENAVQILAMLRAEDQQRIERRDREQRSGYILGGLILLAVGAGLGIMLAVLDNGGGSWSVALIPFLIGAVLLGAGLFQNPAARPSHREVK